MIRATDISVPLGRRQIVRGVTFEARAGELVAIVGPNGSGKTTLMRALTGELAAEGRIELHGRDISSMRPWELAGLRAVLPQATTLSFPFTVREIVALGLSAGHSGVSPSRVGALPEEALAAVDLEGFAGRHYQELSGGEQQRVQLARVLCQIWAPVFEGRARCLFLDEPVSSLDIRHQLAIMEIARDYARRGGASVAILHDLNLAAMFADRVCVIRQGEVAAFGTPAEVLRDDLLEHVFGCRLRVGVAPPPGTPFVLPQTAA